MSDVTRYKMGPRGLEIHLAGSWISYSDYEALASRLDERAKYEDALISSNRLLAEERDAALGRLGSITQVAADAVFESSDPLKLRDALQNIINLASDDEWDKQIAADTAAGKLDFLANEARQALCNCDAQLGERHSDGCNALSPLVVERQEIKS